MKQITHVWLPLKILEEIESLGFTISSMYLVPKEALSNPLEVETFKAPSQINIICPHCNKPLELHSEHQDWRNCGKDKDLDLCSLRRDCYLRECKKPIHFIMLNPNDWQQDYGNSSALWMYPHPRNKLPLKEIDNILEKDFPDANTLKAHYHSAVKEINQHSWPQSTFFSGLLLEGLIHKILPKDKRGWKLDQQIRAFPEHINLAKPIFLLADSLRGVRNLNDHYHEGKTVDEGLAVPMLDLVEELIKYLYVLPEQIEHLGKLLKEKNSSKDNSDEDKKYPVTLMLSQSSLEKLDELSQNGKITQSGIVKNLLKSDKAIKKYKPLPEKVSVELDRSQLEKLRIISEILDFSDASSISNLLDRINID